jgi:hypothetical protein
MTPQKGCQWQKGQVQRTIDVKPVLHYTSEAEQLAEKETGGYDQQIQGTGTKIERQREGRRPLAS